MANSAAHNNVFLVNYTGQDGTLTVNGKSASVKNGASTLITDALPSGAGNPIQNIKVSGPVGDATISLDVSGGTNSWSTLVFTDNGYVNVFASPQGTAVPV